MMMPLLKILQPINGTLQPEQKKKFFYPAIKVQNEAFILPSFKYGILLIILHGWFLNMATGTYCWTALHTD